MLKVTHLLLVIDCLLLQLFNLHLIVGDCSSKLLIFFLKLLDLPILLVSLLRKRGA